jgi:hypothetical protein
MYMDLSRTPPESALFQRMFIPDRKKGGNEEKKRTTDLSITPPQSALFPRLFRNSKKGNKKNEEKEKPRTYP